MAASYPTSTKSFSTKTPGQTVASAHINELQDEVVAIENALRTSLAHDLLFVDATYDIGKSGATRPRDGFFSRNVTVGGLFTVGGFGTHSFIAGGTGINALRVRNSTAGTGNYAGLYVGQDSNASLTALESYSSTLTPTGPYLPDGSALIAAGAGGISYVASNGAGMHRWSTGGTTERMRLHASGGLSIGDATDPGAGLLRVAGFGTNKFDATGGTGVHALQVRNVSSGVTNAAAIYLGQDVDAALGVLQSNASNFTTSGVNVASRFTVMGDGAGGLGLGARHGSGAVYFFAGGSTEAGRLHASRGWSFGSTTDPGSTNVLIGGALETGDTLTVGSAGGNVSWGTYTPTGVGGGITTAVSTFGAKWSRVGDVVTVSGGVWVSTSIGGGAASITLTLPIASALSAAEDVNGTAVGYDSSRVLAGRVIADTSGDVAFLEFLSPAGVSLSNYYFSYIYSYNLI